jgi:hypothetical protein
MRKRRNLVGLGWTSLFLQGEVASQERTCAGVASLRLLCIQQVTIYIMYSTIFSINKYYHINQTYVERQTAGKKQFATPLHSVSLLLQRAAKVT